MDLPALSKCSQTPPGKSEKVHHSTKSNQPTLYYRVAEHSVQGSTYPVPAVQLQGSTYPVLTCPRLPEPLDAYTYYTTVNLSSPNRLPLPGLLITFLDLPTLYYSTHPSPYGSYEHLAGPSLPHNTRGLTFIFRKIHLHGFC